MKINQQTPTKRLVLEGSLPTRPSQDPINDPLLKALDATGADPEVVLNVLRALNGVFQSHQEANVAVKIIMETYGGSNPKSALELTLKVDDQRNVTTSSESKFRNTPIHDLPLRREVKRSLAEAGILTVGQLCERTSKELRRLPKVGHTTLKNIEKCLEDLGLCLLDGGRKP